MFVSLNFPVGIALNYQDVLGAQMKESIIAILSATLMEKIHVTRSCIVIKLPALVKINAIQAMKSTVLPVMEETRFVEPVKIVPKNQKVGLVNALLISVVRKSLRSYLLYQLERKMIS